MKRNILLASRLREVFINGQWIANTNYKAQLRLITFEQAIHKIATLNTIALLTYHINYYLAGLVEAFNTGVLSIKDQHSFNLPPITTESDWQQLVNTFLANAEKFAAQVEQMPEEQLDEPFIAAQYGTTLRNIEAVIEHSYYHLGQIVLLKKLIDHTKV
jgi:uncharacterized damage-inducible protein DinB